LQHRKAKAFIVRDSSGQVIVSPKAQNLQRRLVEDARRHYARELILLQDKELKHGQITNTDWYWSPKAVVAKVQMVQVRRVVE
jgi:hypothetical protein